MGGVLKWKYKFFVYEQSRFWVLIDFVFKCDDICYSIYNKAKRICDKKQFLIYQKIRLITLIKLCW